VTTRYGRMDFSILVECVEARLSRLSESRESPSKDFFEKNKNTQREKKTPKYEPSIWPTVWILDTVP
jgi:hypothetical protein